MTLDEFRSKYRLQTRLTQGGVASYRAADASGRVVGMDTAASVTNGSAQHGTDRLQPLHSVTGDHAQHVVGALRRRQRPQHAVQPIERDPLPQAPRIGLSLHLGHVLPRRHDPEVDLKVTRQPAV